MDIALPRLVYRLTLLFLLMLPEIFLLLYYFLLQFFSWLLSVSLLVTFWITLYSHTDLLDLGSLADAKRRLPVSCSHLCTIQGKGVDVRNSSSTLCSTISLVYFFAWDYRSSSELQSYIILRIAPISTHHHIFQGIKQEFRSKMRSRQMLDAWKGPPANIAASGHIYNRRKA